MDTAHLRGEPIDERQRLSQVFVVLRHDISDEPRRRQLPRITTPFTASIGDGDHQRVEERGERQVPRGCGVGEGHVTAATEVDAVALEHLRAFGVVEDEVCDGLRGVEHEHLLWVFEGVRSKPRTRPRGVLSVLACGSQGASRLTMSSWLRGA